MLAFGSAELHEGVGGPRRQGQVLLVLVHEVVETDGASCVVLGFIQGGLHEHIQFHFLHQQGQAQADAQQGLAAHAASDVPAESRVHATIHRQIGAAHFHGTHGTVLAAHLHLHIHRALVAIHSEP